MDLEESVLIFNFVMILYNSVFFKKYNRFVLEFFKKINFFITYKDGKSILLDKK